MLNKKIPDSPGVYWFLNEKGKVLYVGKAKNLKSRVKSYKHVKGGKAKELVQKSETVKYKITDSEFEAILLEAELIKLYKPFYNLLQKDNKSPLYIYFTKEDFPSIKTSRLERINKLKINKNNVFGPYPSGYKAKQILKFLRRVFPFCDATEKQKQKKKACFYYHINLCPGACVGKITKTDYQKNIKNIKLMLRGKKRSLVKNLKKEMKDASSKKRFEHALILKKQIDVLESLKDLRKSVELNIPTLEVDTLKEKTNSLLRLLVKHLNLPNNYPLKRIECYDVSNIKGKNPTASMVVFKKGKPDFSEYKMFKINKVKGISDTKMLKEALSRRAKHNEWGMPNLIVVDGGKGQLNSAINSVSWNIPIVSIAKNPDRLIIKNRVSQKYTVIVLKDQNPESKLLKHLRDESHRFAKKFHTNLRKKDLTTYS